MCRMLKNLLSQEFLSLSSEQKLWNYRFNKFPTYNELAKTRPDLIDVLSKDWPNQM